ncbi:MAG: sugar phosphate isomerase/epimerase [Rhodothermales bacterium]|jgi:sugar phosphate isomerase/epimerase
MKSLLPLGLLILVCAACTDSNRGHDKAESESTAIATFDAPLGVQLWSFRAKAQEDPLAMLEMVNDMGFAHVETAGLYDMAADSFAQAISAAGLQVSSMHVSLDEMKTNMGGVIADAKAVGAGYVGTAWYPHEGDFTEADARQAIMDFNELGRALKDAGLQFFYHNHGYEPRPYGDGTLLDLIIDETDPDLVAFEMDVLWTWLPNVDPVALIQRHPGRFKLMHIKDMQPGIERGSLSGGLPAEQKAVIGQGQVNWPALLEAAQADGFEHFYLEEESTDPIGNAPKSVAYLKTMTYREDREDRQAEVAAAGASVMAFDLDRTTHVFEPTEDGGLQTVLSDDGDEEQVALIRAHLAEEAERFARGDFHDPAMIHGDDMAGLHALMTGHERMDVAYQDVALGGEIRYQSEDADLVTAIHSWFEAQVRDHGDHAQSHE